MTYIFFSHWFLIVKPTVILIRLHRKKKCWYGFWILHEIVFIYSFICPCRFRYFYHDWNAGVTLYFSGRCWDELQTCYTFRIGKFIQFICMHYAGGILPTTSTSPILDRINSSTVCIGRVQFQFIVCQAMWFRYSWRKMAKIFANIEDPDQTPDLALYCLSVTLLGVSTLKTVKGRTCL